MPSSSYNTARILSAREGRIACLASLLVVGALWAPRPAGACGALVYQAHEERAGGMSDQEVVYLVSETQTVVVVSAGYVEGDDDFAFLLPVGSAPDDVRDGDPRLFYALDEGTAPRVTIVDETTAEFSSGGGGCGCGAAGDTAAGGGGEPNDEVVVVDRGATSTYDYAVVGGTSGDSLSDWLAGEGFTVPTDFEGALQDYLDDGWLFLAARVQPGAADGVLSPIELRFPGASPSELTFPIGISAYSLPPDGEVSITLYVIANEGVVPADYGVVRIPSSELRALSPTRSNYEQVLAAQTDSMALNAFVLESRLEADTMTTLSDWLARAGDAGRVPDDLPEGETSVADFEALATTALGGSLRVARFRTQLTAIELRDTSFTVESFTVVDPEYVVYWSGEPVGGDGGDVGFGLVGVLGLATALGWRRRARARCDLMNDD